MEWYLKVIKQYSDFRGRARRTEFWTYSLFYIVGAMALSMLTIGTKGIGLQMGEVINGLYPIVHIIPFLAVLTRRLHDTGKSGWTLLIFLIPLVGSIILLVFLCQDSSPGVNHWGPNPKDPIEDDYNYEREEILDDFYD